MTTPRTSTTSTALTAALGALSLAAAVRAQTVTLYVDDDAPSGGDGRSWSTAFNDLQDALAAVNNPAARTAFEVRVAQGTYRPDRRTGDRLASFRIRPIQISSAFSLEIQGGYAGLGATNPDELNPAVFTSVLSADLRGNDGPDDSTRQDNAACLINAEAPTGLRLYGLTFDGVWTQGVYAEHGAIRIATGFDQHHFFFLILGHCSIRQCRNSVVNIDCPGYVLVNRCTLSENKGTLFGIRDADLNLSESVIANNHGVLISGPSASLMECTVAGNTQSVNDWAALIGVNSASCQSTLFAANSNTYAGLIAARSVELYACTIVGGSSTHTPPVTCEDGWVIDSVFRDNDVGGVPRSLRTWGLLNVQHSDIQGGPESVVVNSGASLDWDESNLVGDPLFADPNGPDGDPSTWEDNSYLLQPTSPCIDRGSHFMYGGGDAGGSPRLRDGDSDGTVVVDMGAFEFQPSYCPADVNHDHRVDEKDFEQFMYLIGVGDLVPEIDLNHDGFITGDDWDAFIAAFESGC